MSEKYVDYAIPACDSPFLPSVTVIAERQCFHRHLSYCPQRGYAWQGVCVCVCVARGLGACMAGGMCGRGVGPCGEGACMAGGVHGRGHAWQGACVGRHA